MTPKLLADVWLFHCLFAVENPTVAGHPRQGLREYLLPGAQEHLQSPPSLSQVLCASPLPGQCSILLIAPTRQLRDAFREPQLRELCWASPPGVIGLANRSNSPRWDVSSELQ